MDQEQPDMSFGSPDRLAAWRARPWRFKLQHRCNVLAAFIQGKVTWRSCLFGLASPEAVRFLAAKPPVKGLIYVCPETLADLAAMDEACAAEADTTPACAFH